MIQISINFEDKDKALYTSENEKKVNSLLISDGNFRKVDLKIVSSNQKLLNNIPKKIKDIHKGLDNFEDETKMVN